MIYGATANRKTRIAVPRARNRSFLASRIEEKILRSGEKCGAKGRDAERGVGRRRRTRSTTAIIDDRDRRRRRRLRSRFYRENARSRGSWSVVRSEKTALAFRRLFLRPRIKVAGFSRHIKGWGRVRRVRQQRTRTIAIAEKHRSQISPDPERSLFVTDEVIVPKNYWRSYCLFYVYLLKLNNKYNILFFYRFFTSYTLCIYKERENNNAVLM